METCPTPFINAPKQMKAEDQLDRPSSAMTHEEVVWLDLLWFWCEDRSGRVLALDDMKELLGLSFSL